MCAGHLVTAEAYKAEGCFLEVALRVIRRWAQHVLHHQTQVTHSANLACWSQQWHLTKNKKTKTKPFISRMK